MARSWSVASCTGDRPFHRCWSLFGSRGGGTATGEAGSGNWLTVNSWVGQCQPGRLAAPPAALDQQPDIDPDLPAALVSRVPLLRRLSGAEGVTRMPSKAARGLPA